MSTKDKIIKEAIRQYNLNGLHNTTSRHIAAELGISHGNLEYHYPDKEKILQAIYEQMKEKSNKLYVLLHDDTLDAFSSFMTFLEGLVELQIEYRFFNQDVLEIYRKYEQVNQLLKETLLVREKQLIDLWARFDEDGLIKKEDREGVYARIRHQIRILLTFWSAQEIVLAHFNQSGNTGLIHMIWDVIYPHMTNEGRDIYNQLVS